MGRSWESLCTNTYGLAPTFNLAQRLAIGASINVHLAGTSKPDVTRGSEQQRQGSSAGANCLDEECASVHSYIERIYEMDNPSQGLSTSEFRRRPAASSLYARS